MKERNVPCGESFFPLPASYGKRWRRENPVRTIIAVTIAGIFLLLGFLHFQAKEPYATQLTSSSQIYIHGTPVCVTQQGKDIVAQVGECGLHALPPESESLERLPFHGHSGRNLPPGHPPIDEEMFPAGNRRVLI